MYSSSAHEMKTFEDHQNTTTKTRTSIQKFSIPHLLESTLIWKSFWQIMYEKLIVSPSAKHSKLKFSHSNLTKLTYCILRLVQINQIWNECLAKGKWVVSFLVVLNFCHFADCTYKKHSVNLSQNSFLWFSDWHF